MRQNKFSSRTILQYVLWCILVPQIILIGLNIYSWMLIRLEAGPKETKTALTLFGVEILILIVVFLVCLFFKYERLSVGKQLSFISLIAHASYMWMFLGYVGDAIPNSIQPWILNEGNVGMWNITLFMPGAFISLYAFTKGVFSDVSDSQSGWITLGVTLGVPLLWYLFVTLMQPTWLGQISTVVWIIVSTILVIIFLGAFINMFDSLIHKELTGNLITRHYWMAILLGIVAPLGGLLLNRTIPFPVDFQSIYVYAFTIVNGLILLLKPGATNFLTTKVFLRFFSFPFTIYFFLVFLPFLPLSLLAILVLGAGLLMLTPLALGLFQFRVTQSDFQELVNKIGKRRSVVVAMIGILVLPSYFVLEAGLDKRALNSTLNYFYAHDYEAPALSERQMSRSKKALVELRDRKQGLQLPYLSGIYNYIVFGDMVLSDAKIKQAYKWLSNEELPEFKGSAFDLFSRDGNNNSRERIFRTGFVSPERNVTISNIETIRETGSATVRVEMKNHSNSTHSLFVSGLNIPEGVFVSGLRLKIEDEWVDGKIFDKKTALWVFQKITEVRQDPAIIYYTSLRSMELRVYPFPEKGIREVELDFVFHPEQPSTIQLGETAIKLNPSVVLDKIVSSDSGVIVDSFQSNNLISRKPYLHFVFDYSSDSVFTKNSQIEIIKKVTDSLGVKDLKIVAANISVSIDKTNTMLNIDDLAGVENYIDNIQHARLGGFWIEKALAGEIIRVSKNLDNSNFSRKPIFVVIKSGESEIAEVDLNDWDWLIPDMSSWYSYQGKALSAHKINEYHSEQEVLAIRQNDSIHILPANNASILDVDSSGHIEIYENASRSFVPLTPKIIKQENKDWKIFSSIWLAWKKLNTNPSDIERERANLLATSRDNKLLLPVTSFIVVESASQWEIMKRKEKQAMASHGALDFEEEKTSEPPAWMLLILLMGFLFYMEWRKTSRTSYQTL